MNLSIEGGIHKRAFMAVCPKHDRHPLVVPGVKHGPAKNILLGQDPLSNSGKDREEEKTDFLLGSLLVVVKLSRAFPLSAGCASSKSHPWSFPLLFILKTLSQTSASPPSAIYQHVIIWRFNQKLGLNLNFLLNLKFSCENHHFCKWLSYHQLQYLLQHHQRHRHF